MASVYSFSLHGNFPKEILLKKKYKAFGDEPVFNFLNENNGKIAILDLPDQNSMTFYHYIEEKLNASWRYHKEFCVIITILITRLQRMKRLLFL